MRMGKLSNSSINKQRTVSHTSIIHIRHLRHSLFPLFEKNAREVLFRIFTKGQKYANLVHLGNGPF